MGNIRDARCPCGFRSSVKIGGGMVDHRENSAFPFHCKTCGLISVNVAKEERICPTCQSSEITQYGKEPVSLPGPHGSAVEWGNYKARAIDHLCPRCNQHTMAFDGPSIMFD
jgi:RNA polymerase subunit RPABC4/transcription elongation factor Spt4